MEGVNKSEGRCGRVYGGSVLGCGGGEGRGT